MGKKALVVYASKAGSTGEIAEAVAEVLRGQGWQADVKLVKNAGDIKDYQAVIVGSCIRMGAWLPEAVEFVKSNQAALSRVPTAFFMASGFYIESQPETHKTSLAYLDPVRAILEPGSIGVFGGKMDFSKLSLIDRMISKMVKSKEGDTRNWEAIRTWAGAVLPVA